MAETKRNIIFDAIKAFAILLVVLGHSIQYVSGLDYWNDHVFQIIYSFHMQLFFIVSGFFFQSSLKLNIGEFLYKKSISLLLPCFVWAVIFSILDFNDIHTLLWNIIDPRKWPFWFLKELFKVQFVIYVCAKIGERIQGGAKKQMVFAILLSLLVYFLPFMSIARIMVPMFWIGYIIFLNYEWFKKNYLIIGTIAIMLYVMLYVPLAYHWKSDYTQYYSGFPMKMQEILWDDENNIKNLLTLLYRLSLGVAGSVAIIAYAHIISSLPSIAANIGTSTQGIYITQAFILEYLCGVHIPLFSTWIDSIALLWISLVGFAIIIVSLCSGLYFLIKRIPILGLLLYGQRNTQASITH